MAGHYLITSGSRVIYDGTDAYPAFDISFKVGNQEAGSLEFTMPRNHPSWGYVNIRSMSNPIVVKFLTEYNGSTSYETVLFVGYAGSIDTDESGMRRVKCFDEWAMLEDIYLTAGELGYTRPTDFSGVAAIILTAIYKYRSTISTTVDVSSLVHRVEPGITHRYTKDSNIGYGNYDYDMEKTISVASMIRDLAQRSGSVAYISYTQDLTRTIMLDSATYSSANRKFTYGENLIDARVWYDTDDYFNAAYATGGNYKYFTGGVGHNITLHQDAQEGSSYIKVKGRFTVRNGQWLIIHDRGEVGVCYKSLTDAELSESNPTDLLIEPPLQQDVSTDGTVLLYESTEAHPIVEHERICRISGTAQMTVNSKTYYRVDGLSAIYSSSDNNYGIKAVEYTNSEIVYEKLLFKRAIEYVEARLSIARNVDASVLEPCLIDNVPHLTIGGVVNVVHEGIGVNDILMIRGLSIKVGNPSSSSYTFGKARKGFIEKMSDVNRSLDIKIRDARNMR